MPPNAAAMSPLLPLCSNTTMIRNKQTAMWTIVINMTMLKDLFRDRYPQVNKGDVAGGTTPSAEIPPSPPVYCTTGTRQNTNRAAEYWRRLNGQLNKKFIRSPAQQSAGSKRFEGLSETGFGSPRGRIEPPERSESRSSCVCSISF